jgi:stage II sporulation protein D
VTVRKLALTLAFALLLPLGAQARTFAPDARVAIDPARLLQPVFVVRGHGWGHGVGMSQWGAYGFARAGSTYQKILSHYYQGTTLGPAPVRRVRVQLAAKAQSLLVSSTDSLRVRDATAMTYALDPGSYTIKPDLKLKVDPDAKPRALPGPLTFIAGTQPLSLGDRAYRGTLEISVVNGKLQAINVVGLEQYLYGVVPSEVPDDWPSEALKAQAVVARSYALSHMQTGAFDLFADTRSQVYRGVPEEVPSTTAAVNATAGQVVLYNGRVANTYYHSTSGGRTANIADVWPGSQPIPYLVSVPDPYDNASPYHDWGPFLLSRERLARVLKVPGKLVDVSATTNPSLRVNGVVGIAADGTGPEIDATTFRRSLDLRSTWFTIGVLAMEKPAAPLAFGSKLNLGAVARGLGKVTVEQRTAGQPAWTPFSTVAPRADGTLTVAVKPKVATLYRLATDEMKSVAVRVAVAPLVRISAAMNGLGLVGLVRPALPGTVVQVQRLVGTAWKPAASARVEVTGRWQATLELRRGSYRARVPAATGLAAGTSQVLAVTGP